MRRNYDALRIDRDSDTPMCVQLAVNIGKAIRDGWWSEDEALPSERMLSGWLKVSRVTTRRAFDQLVAEGWVERVADGDDRRAMIVRMTRNGKKHFGAMAQAHEQWLDQLLAPLGMQAARDLYDQLGKLRQTLAQTNGIATAD